MLTLNFFVRLASLWGLLFLSCLGAYAQTSGGLDPTFDPGDGFDDAVYSLAVQADGKIVVGGIFSSFQGIPRQGIARLHPDGTLDETFNPGSGFEGSASFSGRVFSIAIQADGKIVTGGSFSGFDGSPRNGIARLNPDGSLDDTFDPGDGFEKSSFRINQTEDIALQADGKIVAVGFFDTFDNIARDGIARLNPDGSIDTSFVPVPDNGFDGQASSIVIQPDAKIIIGGDFESLNGIGRNAIARLNPDGSLDESFDPGDGFQVFSIPGPVFDMVLQADGKLVAGGDFISFNGIPRQGLARLNPDGSLDESFDPGDGLGIGARPVLDLVGDRIMLAGFFETYNNTPRKGIARLNPDGSLDEIFDPGEGFNDGVRALLVQADSNIVLGGSFTNYDGTPRSYIARLFGGDIPALPGPIITGFNLINADADTVIQALQEGDIINLNDLEGAQFNIEALSETAGSIRMELKGLQTLTGSARTENNAPYALFANKGPNFFGRTMAPQEYELSAIGYTENNLEGVEGEMLQISFSFVRQVADFELSRVDLVDAGADVPLASPLMDGATYEIADLANRELTFAAYTLPSQIGSVHFDLQGPTFFNRTENVPPYVADANRGSNFFGRTLLPGAYTLTVTPYSETARSGLAGAPLEFNFTLLHAATGLALETFPNVSTEGVLNIRGNADQGAQLMLLSSSGLVLYQQAVSGKFETQVRMEDMVKGSYHVILYNQEDRVAKTVLKAN